MNFIDTMASVELVLAANQVPLLVGETGIGKTSLAARVAEVHNWELVTIDGNLLKEGEIGGLPTVETVTHTDGHGNTRDVKTTVYAVHHTLEHVAIKMRRSDKNIIPLALSTVTNEIRRSKISVSGRLLNKVRDASIVTATVLILTPPPVEFGPAPINMRIMVTNKVIGCNAV